MNEHVGLILCPQCKGPWDDGQIGCAYCGNTTPPEACRAYAPWAWYVLGIVLIFVWLIDRRFGGFLWRSIAPFFQATP